MSTAEANVRSAEQQLASAKANLASAKQNGNYKRASKNIRSSDGKLGNSYDANVWSAQDLLKRRKKELADAKAREKAEKAKQKKEMAKQTKSSGGSYKSSSGSSSSSSYSYDDDDDYEDEVEEVLSPEEQQAREEEERRRREEERERREAERERRELEERVYELHTNMLKTRYPIESATDTQLAEWLPKIVGEIDNAKDTFKEYAPTNFTRRYVKLLKDTGVQAVRRLKSLNNKLLHEPEVLAVAKRLDPECEDGMMKKLFNSLFAPSMSKIKDSYTNPFKKFLDKE